MRRGAPHRRSGQRQQGEDSAFALVHHNAVIPAVKRLYIDRDPNDWGMEHDDPTYILDLVGRVVTVSMHTLDIIDGLPSLEL